MNSYSPVVAQHARPDYDRTLLWLVILLLGFGLVMVYSSSIAISAASKHTGFQESYYLMRQAVRSIITRLRAFSLESLFL